MTDSVSKKDIFVLVADEHMQRTMQSLCGRYGDLGTCRFAFTVDRHLGRDSGCRVYAIDHLKPISNRYCRCIVMFDYHGSGTSESRRNTQVRLEKELEDDWNDRVKVIVIEPELEAWVWGDMAALSKCLGWPDGGQLRDWLSKRNLWCQDHAKPRDPKQAMKQATWHAPTRRWHRISGRLFGELAKTTNLNNCQDPAFQELRATLQCWFPPEKTQ